MWTRYTFHIRLTEMLVCTFSQSKIAHLSSAGGPLLHHVGEGAWRGGEMYDRETKMLLKHYLEQGVSKAGLARRFQLSRRTIHYWIESGQLDRELAAGAGGYARRAPTVHKLDPYQESVRHAWRCIRN